MPTENSLQVADAKGMADRVRPSFVGSIAALLLSAGIACGKLCGDNVDGRDVPCACGDTIVSDVVLSDDDPVTQTVCPVDGIVVRATRATYGITVDLHGKTLRGSGKGTAVWVVYGGPGGARLISETGPAHIEGFLDGVVAEAVDSVQLIEGLLISSSTHDGVRVRANEYRIHATEVEHAGRDGFSLSGHGFQISATRALSSGRFGYFITGTNGIVGVPGAGNRSERSGHAGFRVSGTGHRLIDCVAFAAAKTGVQLGGMHYTVSGCVAEHNLGNGIAGNGVDWHVRGNRATDNEDNGLVMHGLGLEDGGGNSGARNRGRHEHTPTQCAINGVTCAQ